MSEVNCEDVVCTGVKKWRSENKEKYAAYHRKYYSEHKEEINARRRENRAANKEEKPKVIVNEEEVRQKQKAAARKYRDSHKEVIAERYQEWYARNKDKRREYQKEWMKNKRKKMRLVASNIDTAN